jgi:hypothetical protein
VTTIAWIVVFCLAASSPLLAQSTFATITGSVSDPSGLAVPGATVEATHVRSNYKYTTNSNDAGVYSLAQLREGEYVLRVHAAGFKEHVAHKIELASRDVRRLDVQLEIGAMQTSVEVSAGATSIETETARIGDYKGLAAIQSLPLNIRGILNFVLFSPGVLQAGAGSAHFRFAGSGANQWDRSIDGITIGNLYDGTSIGPLNSFNESFQEVRIDMANNTAEFGTIGQVSIISKSGTNELLGSLFDFYSTPWFRARNPFALERGGGISHNPGGSVGGPIRLPKMYDGRNKSFFYFSFETTRGSAVQQLLNPTVPLAAWREGGFSALAPGTTVRDPFAGGSPFPNNQVSASRINPVSRRIQDRFYPLPNFGDTSVLASQNYRELKSRAFDPSTYWATRIDHRFSDKAFVFGRFTWNRAYISSYDGNLPTIGTMWNQRDTRGFTASYLHTLRPNLLNEFRYGFARNDNPRHGPLLGKQVVQDLGIQGLVDNLPNINGIFVVSFSGIGLTGISQQVWKHPGFRNRVQQFQDHLSWLRGRHNVKAGIIVSRVGFADSTADASLFGNCTFSNRFTGHPYADFLLGIPTSSSRAFPPIVVEPMRWGYDFFVTDDFKVSRSLTVSLGVRYEYRPRWTELNGRQSLFDIDSGKIVVPDGSLDKVSQFLPRQYVDVIEARQLGLPGKSLLSADRNDIAPRIGLAYRPFGNQTVFRTGYGIFYNLVPYAPTTGGSPFVIREPSFTNPAAAPEVILPQVFPRGGVAGPTTVGLPAAARYDLREPFSMQYNLTIEHSRWSTGFRLSYIGTNTRQGEWGYNINQPLPDTRSFIDKPRRFPTYPGITYITNGAGHQYHSMTVEVERPMARGFFYQVSWVWARDIGDLGATPENAYDRERERAVSGTIPTHRVSGNFIYQLPFGRGHRYLSTSSRGLHALVSGWQVAGIYLLQSGQFMTPSWTGPDPVGIAYTTSRTPAQVTLRPNHLRDANLPADQRSPNRWFDVGAFSPPAPGFFGTAANGVIKGPGTNVWHAGLVKYFNLPEPLRLRWEISGTNVFNHPNWANPGTNISSLGGCYQQCGQQ